MLNKITKLTAATAVAMLMSQASIAHEGYVVGSDGNFAKSSDGSCVVHGGSLDTQGCYPKPEPKPEPVVAKPAPVVVPAPVVKPAPAPAPPVRVQQSFSLEGDASFETNSSALTPAGQASVSQFIQKVTSTEGLKVSKIFVLGHADSRGKAAYNQNLSEDRAKSVATYMTNNGIDASVIESAGAGETQPIASNDTVTGRAKNRRVEVSVSGMQTSFK